MSAESQELFVWDSKKSFLEKYDTAAKYINALEVRVRPLAHQKPAWLHSSRLQETLLPFQLRRESNMNGISQWSVWRCNGRLWKEFGGEKLFWVDFREMVMTQ